MAVPFPLPWVTAAVLSREALWQSKHLNGRLIFVLGVWMEVFIRVS